MIDLGTALTDSQIDVLMRDLAPSRVSHRSQGGRSLSYVEAHDIRATLIRIFGFGNFDITTESCEVMNVEKREAAEGRNAQWAVTCLARVRVVVHVSGASYSDVAACTQVNPVLGEAMDFAAKTSVSDALKRCCVNLGTQFGLSLYSDGATRDVVRYVFAPGQERSPAPPAALSEATQAAVARATGQEVSA